MKLLNEMILQEMLVNKARELKIELPDTELDTAYAEAKKNITDEAFQKELATRKLTPADMRDSLRRDMLANKVFEREVTSKIIVTDHDVTAFFDANKAQFNRPEDAYHIAQIAVTPGRDQQQQPHRRRRSDAAGSRQAKTQMLMERLKAGVRRSATWPPTSRKTRRRRSAAATWVRADLGAAEGAAGLTGRGAQVRPRARSTW